MQADALFIVWWPMQPDDYLTVWWYIQADAFYCLVHMQADAWSAV